MLIGTFTVRCWNYAVGRNRGFIELLEDAGISITENNTRFSVNYGENVIECFYKDGVIYNKKTDRKICEYDVQEISYNFKPSSHDERGEHEMEVFVCIKDWVSVEDFMEKVCRSTSLKISGDIVSWDDCIGDIVKTPASIQTFMKDNDSLFLKFTVTAVGEKNFLAIDENGDEKMFPKMDGFWFYN